MSFNNKGKVQLLYDLYFLNGPSILPGLWTVVEIRYKSWDVVDLN